MISGSEVNGQAHPERTPDDVVNSHALSEDAPCRKYEQFRWLALAGLTLVLLGLCFLLAVPFLPAITWGGALAIIAWPMHRWITHHVERPGLAALLSSAAVVIVIVVPSLFVTYHLAHEAGAMSDQVQEELGKSTGRGKAAEAQSLEQIVEAEARKIIGSYSKDATGLVQGSFTAVIQFLVAIFILYYLFLDRWMFLHGLRDLLPLSRAESDKVFSRAADSVHANVYADFITSLLDAAGGGLMFWAVGLPSPLLWAVIIFVVSLLPMVGAAIVWLPAVAYLAVTDRWLGGMALLSWGVASFILVDHILYLRLLGGQRRPLHSVPALIAFLGGMAAFGLSGLILGPAILAVTMAFLEVWKERLANDSGSPPIAQEDIIAPTAERPEASGKDLDHVI